MDLRVKPTKERAATKDYSEPARLWWKLEINEWTFSLFVITISLSIVLAKLYNNYGNSDTFGMSHVPRLSDFNVKKLRDTTEKFANVSNHYEDVFANAVTSVFNTYGWLIRAAITGMTMTVYSWYIIYKDSRIPGIDPPFPFSPSRRRLGEESRIQINYFVGVLIGILLFVHMCK